MLVRMAHPTMEKPTLFLQGGFFQAALCVPVVAVLGLQQAGLALGRIGGAGGLGVGYGKAECFGHAFAVGRVASVAIADVAVFDEVQRIAHAAGGVVEQHLLLFGAHQFKQGARLAEVVAVVFALVPVGGIAVDFQRRLGVLRLLLPLAEAVGLVVRFAAVVGVYAALAVAVVAVYGAAGGIHRDLVVVHA